MDAILNQKRKAALKRILKDFPWLWAIRSKWHHWLVVVVVRNATNYEIGRPVSFSDWHFKLWFKIKSHLLGKDESSDEVKEVTPKEERSIASVISQYKNQHPTHDIEYVVLVCGGDVHQEIYIYRPSKPQRAW